MEAQSSTASLRLVVLATVLTMTAGQALTLAQALAPSGNITITTGTLDVSASNFAITLSGNFANSGVFTWRPLVAQADTANPISIVVSDNGSPSLSSTQSFLATVNPLAKPSISSINFSGGQTLIQVGGDAGPDYEVQASTNLDCRANARTSGIGLAPVPPGVGGGHSG